MRQNYKIRKELSFVVMISLALGIRQMSMTLVMPFISTYSKTLSYNTPLLAGAALGTFGIAQALFQIPYGRLSDKIGNKPVVVLGLIQVILGLLLAYFAKNIYVLIFARFLQGSGAIIGSAYSWVFSSASKNNRTKALGILGSFIAIAAALSFAIGPIINRFISVDKMFLLCSLILLINSLYILLFLREDKNKKISKETNSLKSDLKLLFKNKSFITSNLSAFINNFIMVSVFYFLPIYLEKLTGQYGMWKVFLPSILTAVIVMKIVLKFCTKKNTSLIIIFSFTSILLGNILYFNNNSFTYILIGTILFMCGYVCLVTLTANNINNIVDENCRGTGNGVFNSFQYIGSFLGGIFAGAFLSISQKGVLIAIILTALMGIFIVLYGGKNER
ncbi:MFS transporter [Clostridium felsineum]|uniref:Inner membrane transport protein YajR n=1 Tax=Clostridium felsineum TaxID=36839 RepID=A0A1S8LQQ7_9CLOT|nr:MFS transporter [Clostridium felsineum]URZ07755.1 Inner membrane transport protein YajR [Clostridium felsineum]URZ12786.1 Inner membrane transport protein YajR [Clostridium felsineum]